ncbi:SIR2 family NAD-dependent protein deacylase [Lysinibacillus sp. LZ02]|uniref:SIR2 family NAD-dependent protein deacylase n=1 Tax=Lysinibacillus sp. LZ02 TaxID=3420668 RepID=UPI003D3646EA
MDKVNQLADWLRQSTKIVVLTGAGMSTESGVPDFRSKSGWWRNIDPSTVANIQALEHDYDLFHAFYCARFEALQGCEPHEGHHILADWEKRGIIARVATQNVDGFHKAAGNTYVDELHGSIHAVRCHKCGHEANAQAFFDQETCTVCWGKLRPGIVLFGEMLPEDAWKSALHAIKAADLVIVIGTSLQVYPVNQLPSMTRGKLVYINREVHGFERDFDLLFEGSAKETLQQIDAALKG